MWVYGLDLTGPGQRQVADACECGNEPSGSVKCGEFLDQLQTSQLLKKDFASWSSGSGSGSGGGGEGGGGSSINASFFQYSVNEHKLRVLIFRVAFV